MEGARKTAGSNLALAKERSVDDLIGLSHLQTGVLHDLIHNSLGKRHLFVIQKITFKHQMRSLLPEVYNSSFEGGHRSAFCCADIILSGKKGRCSLLSASCHLLMWINFDHAFVVKTLSLHVEKCMPSLNQPASGGI